MLNFLADVTFYGMYVAIAAGLVALCWFGITALTTFQKWLTLAEHIRHNEKAGSR